MMLVTKVLKKTSGEDNKKTEMYVSHALDMIYGGYDILTRTGS